MELKIQATEYLTNNILEIKYDVINSYCYCYIFVQNKDDIFLNSISQFDLMSKINIQFNSQINFNIEFINIYYTEKENKYTIIGRYVE